jgi:TonB family protein
MLAMSYRLIASCSARTKCRRWILAVAFVGAVLASKPLAAQTHDQTTVERKVVNRVEPEYPEALKRLYIGGVVRVEAVVAANGAVESTQLLGGSPILGQSAMKAIKQWKYSPSGSKEKLVVMMEFDPHR